MTSKIVVGPINHGLRKDVTAFNIDDDSFPTLINAYQWRGRVKRKRGTSFLTRLKRYFDSTISSYNAGSTTITLNGSGSGNILTGFSLQSTGNIVPGSVTIDDVTVPQTYTDPAMDGTLTGSLGGSGTIVYSSGVITITGGAGHNVNASFNYYPGLPVMGLEEFVIDSDQFPGTLGFDTKYSYNIVTASPYPNYDVSFYKNPATATYTGYTAKTNATPLTWNGQDYQQFWSVNYQGAIWVTNGVNVPFSTTNIGMQFKPITGVTIDAAGPPALATLTIVGHGLVRGDFVFINEVGGITGINFQTGYVVSADPQAANAVQVEFPNATLGGAYTVGGIAQYLTNRSDTTKDCIRFYDGDPTNGNVTTPTLNGTKGWVNFMPPLSQSNFSIAELPAKQYYLVGCKMIVPFKDRLLFFGAVVQASDGLPIYLRDTVVYSQNGTPYYTASYTNTPSAAVDTPTSSSNIFNAILVPTDETATSPAYFEDATGFGGFVQAGIDQALQTVESNEDVLIVGLQTTQTRLVYTGNDVVPFNFFLIDSELGSSSTFSAINMGHGVMTRGSRGYILTKQVGATRFDIPIPDEVFETRLNNNGPERICAQRDFINEWIYFTYPSNQNSASIYKFPTQTLQYNYRDNTWALFNESYTTYGSFRKQTGFTWQTVGLIYPTWNAWNVPWNAGSSTLLQPEVIAGNAQGFVVTRDDGTDEAYSLTIQSFSGSTITSPNHCLNTGDFIMIKDCIGTISTEVNGKIFSILVVDANSFTLNPTIGTGTYFGGGLIKRMYIPYIQTKQFPVAWELGRKTRIGVQRYLLTKTDNAQIQLLMFLSQNSSSPYNTGPIVPETLSINNSLIYSTILYTCPESTNLGLTPANINLNTPTAGQQSEIWHRVNTSLIGDTVQLGFTLSEQQMREVDDDENPISQFAEIELHGFILDVTPSQMLV